MKITITGRKCSPRESFKEHAEKKLAKIERFFGSDVEAKVTVTVEKSSQNVEITVNNSGMVFRSEERAQNMNEALDKCVDTLTEEEVLNLFSILALPETVGAAPLIVEGHVHWHAPRVIAEV